MSSRESILLYDGVQDWKTSLPRPGKEEQSPFKEFSIGLLGEGGSTSCPIIWRTSIECTPTEKSYSDEYKLHIVTKTRGYHIRRSVGVKCSLLLLNDRDDTIIEHFKSYSHLKGNTSIDTTIASWSVQKQKLSANYVKVITTYQVYGLMDAMLAMLERPSTMQPQGAQPSEKQLQYGVQLAQTLNKDRKEGINTDVILKMGETECKAHKLILVTQSDFFKARFSDHWDKKSSDKKNHEIDMNDSDLNPEVLKALVSGAYTGEVESFEMALKLLPATDKYQFKKLKEVCEYIICCHLTMENMLDTFLLARNCNAQNLQKQCELLIKL